MFYRKPSVKKSLLFLAGSLMAAYLVFNLVVMVQMNDINLHQEKVSNQHQPLMLKITALNAAVNQSVVTLESWIKTGDKFDQALLDSLITFKLTKLQQQLDSSRDNYLQFSYIRTLDNVLTNTQLLIHRLKELRMSDLSETELNDADFKRKILTLTRKLNAQTSNLVNLVDEINSEELIEAKQRQLILRISGGLFFLITLGIFYWMVKGFYQKLSAGFALIGDNLDQLSKGNLPEATPSKFEEIESMLVHIRSLKKNLNNVQEFALAVGEKEFEKEIDIFNNEGIIGKSLLEMRESLKNVAAEEKIRLWTNEGFAKFGDILRKYGDDLQKLSDELISELVKYINANQGGLFIIRDDQKDDVYLELAACYAYQRKKYHERKVLPGQGLIGQCYLEKETINLLEVPQDYIQITSGLGDSTPDNILLVPLKLNNEVFGVVELASFNKIENFEIEFIEKLGESIASTFSSVKINERTRQLLEESQMATEQLRAQEEEMRQNMEELAATQEEMQRNQNALLNNESKTRMVFENSFDAIVTTDRQGNIDLFNPAAEKIFQYSREEIAGKNISILMPEKYAASHPEKISTYHDTGVKTVIGKPRELEGKRKNGEVFPLRVKVDDIQIGEENIFLAFLEDISAEVQIRKTLEKDESRIIENEANFTAVLNSTNDTIFAIDNKYNIKVVNKVLKNKYSKLGIELEPGKNILEVLPPELAEGWKIKYDRALKGEQFSYTEQQQSEENNSSVEVFLNPIRNNKGDVTGALIVSRDISKYVQDHDQLEGEIERLKMLQQEIEKEKALLESQKTEVNGDKNPELQELFEKQILSHQMLLMQLNENENRLKDSLVKYHEDLRKKKGL